ncbi:MULTISPECIES: Eco57I restriction-modification methylase domain-containing protein [unclassified Dietzia]|uniref:Eco57I restriction-modification methylase domain-containing protein n=1 Tax=unclassified Dietzia TaxID=2617939 RepID=UPI001E2F13A7|nr:MULTISPECIES: Eco57I restriction-modification methylase domain-containing protein [unclassified Dietzia]
MAQLSTDEVPTPPDLARAMLELLPEEVWTRPDYVWLDPFSKSGVFLREVATRLLDGLAEWEPDFVVRRDHIFRNMLFGAAITEMTGIISRRSVYCSADASGHHSLVQFDDPQGNLLYVPSEHHFGSDDRCTLCNVPKDLERGRSRENYAYSFIHGTYPTKEMADMKFDVIVGNPPYQLKDGGHNASAVPIYQLFVQKALALNPRYVVMITQSRWFAGGRGLDSFRNQMLTDGRIRKLVDYPKLYDAFPGVKVRGGVSYFLWDRDNPGLCEVQTMWDGVPVGPPMERSLCAYDVLVRRNEAVAILEKVRAYRVAGKPEPVLKVRVSGGKPFGFRTYFHGVASPDRLKNPVKFYGSQKISWIERADVRTNSEWVDDWKVLMTAVQGTSAAVETKFLSDPIVAGPGTACSETYLVAGRFESESEAQWYASYLRTRFVRFLVSLRKATQHATRDVYAFVPDVPLSQTWTDELLFARYGITGEEAAFIASQVKEMPAPSSGDTIDA